MDLLILLSLLMTAPDVEILRSQNDIVPPPYTENYQFVTQKLPYGSIAEDSKLDALSLLFALDIAQESVTDDNIKTQLQEIIHKTLNTFLNHKDIQTDKFGLAKDTTKPSGYTIKDTEKFKKASLDIIGTILQKRYTLESLDPVKLDIFMADFETSFKRLQQKLLTALGQTELLISDAELPALKEGFFPADKPFEGSVIVRAPNSLKLSDAELQLIQSKTKENTTLSDGIKKIIQDKDLNDSLTYIPSDLDKAAEAMGTAAEDIPPEMRVLYSYVGEKISVLFVALISVPEDTLSDDEKNLINSIKRKFSYSVFASFGNKIIPAPQTITAFQLQDPAQFKERLAHLIKEALLKTLPGVSPQDQASIDTDFDQKIRDYIKIITTWFGVNMLEESEIQQIILGAADSKPMTQTSYDALLPNRLTDEEIAFVKDNIDAQYDPLGRSTDFMNGFTSTTPLTFQSKKVTEKTVLTPTNFMDFLHTLTTGEDTNAHHVMAALEAAMASKDLENLSDNDKATSSSILRKILKVVFGDLITLIPENNDLMVRRISELLQWDILWTGISFYTHVLKAKYNTTTTQQNGLNESARADFNRASQALFPLLTNTVPHLKALLSIYGESENFGSQVAHATQPLLYRLTFKTSPDSKILSDTLLQNFYMLLLGDIRGSGVVAYSLMIMGEKLAVNFQSIFNTTEPTFYKPALDEIKERKEQLKTNAEAAKTAGDPPAPFDREYLISSLMLADLMFSALPDDLAKDDKEDNEDLVNFAIGNYKDVFTHISALFFGQMLFKNDAGLVPNGTTQSGLGLSPAIGSKEKFQSFYSQMITAILQKRYSVQNPDQDMQAKMAADFPETLMRLQNMILGWFDLDHSFGYQTEADVEALQYVVLPFTKPEEVAGPNLSGIGKNFYDTTYESEMATQKLKEALANKEAMKSNEDGLATAVVKEFIDTYAKNLNLEGGLTGAIAYLRKDGPAETTKLYKNYSFSWVTAGIPMVGDYTELDKATARCVERIANKEVEIKDKEGNIVKLKLGQIFDTPKHYHSVYAAQRIDTPKDGKTPPRAKVYCGGLFSTDRGE